MSDSAPDRRSDKLIRDTSTIEKAIWWASVLEAAANAQKLVYEREYAERKERRDREER